MFKFPTQIHTAMSLKCGSCSLLSLGLLNADRSLQRRPEPGGKALTDAAPIISRGKGNL
jgi:hypothetical protein